jgi:hypothetical protein
MFIIISSQISTGFSEDSCKRCLNLFGVEPRATAALFLSAEEPKGLRRRSYIEFRCFSRLKCLACIEEELGILLFF